MGGSVKMNIQIILNEFFPFNHMPFHSIRLRRNINNHLSKWAIVMASLKWQLFEVDSVYTVERWCFRVARTNCVVQNTNNDALTCFEMKKKHQLPRKRWRTIVEHFWFHNIIFLINVNLSLVFISNGRGTPFRQLNQLQVES